jgi:hypothetical protein
MPRVELVPLAEIKQRQKFLMKQAARMPSGKDREAVLAEIELLHGLAQLKQSLSQMVGQLRPCTGDRSKVRG